jgi:signal transduction histidine kinase
LKSDERHTDELLREIAALKSQLHDANSIIEAIQEGSVDALVLHKDGQPHIYSIESADYTYRILIEKFSEGALNITEDGLILYCNDSFARLMGIPATQITGSYFENYISTVPAYELLKFALRDGQSKGEMMLKGADGCVPVYASFTDLKPNVGAVGVILTDLTEKKKHEAALVRYQHELEEKVNELNTSNVNLEQFIHVISHDLKEPLRKILTYISRLSPDGAFESTETASMQVIKSSALRLNSLVDDLVKYAFVANDKEDEVVSLNEVVREVLDDLEFLILENKASIESADLPEIKGSRVQMRQLFSNLITNAIKYSRADVTPAIRIAAEKSMVPKSGQEQELHRISLHDNGIGIEAAHLGKIFTIFQRLHMRNEYSGNGIGLAICQKIMENHAGSIAVESIPGTGSSFHLHFPINKQA